ncbi:hypothetical protein WN55_10009 [Dufourea novaeangliae]|uniref:Uncharacterized protein n=1 Tax=Dufourea novaeangliae TaxID=178035 RepID=A0A154PA86_DUFNO|nr:hypothetical protein WN55_10009 [Dufourea novaeangliae]
MNAQCYIDMLRDNLLHSVTKLGISKTQKHNKNKRMATLQCIQTTSYTTTIVRYCPDGSY